MRTDPLADNTTYGVLCDTTGGSSRTVAGSDNNTGAGDQMSVNSYGYSGATTMYDTKFNTNTQATWNRALTTNTNSIVT